MTARIRLSGGVNASLVVVYSPTDGADRATKDAFYLQLHSVLDALPSRDMLVLLGDFNGQVGNDPRPYGGVMGPWGLARKGNEKEADNGECRDLSA